MELAKSLVEFFQSSISPLVLISGVGLILLSLTNRLARTIDRSRGLVSDIEKTSLTEKEIENKKVQLKILVKRSYILKYSIGSISFSILCSSLIIPVLLIMNLFKINLEAIGIAFFILSVSGIITSALFLFADVNLTLKALEYEVAEHIK